MEIARERALSKRGAFKEARRVLDVLIPKLRASGSSSDLSGSLTDLGILLTSEGDYTNALEAEQEAEKVSRGIGDLEGEARALDNCGIAQLFLGRYPAAQISFTADLLLVRKLKDTRGQVQAENNLGSVFFYRGIYTQAMLQYQEASRILDTSKGKPWFDDWRQVTDVNIATLYQRLGQFDNALRIYRQVRASSQKLSPADHAQLLSNLGAVYRHRGDPYKSLESYGAALTLLERQKNADETLGVLQNIGTVYALDRGDLPRARREFRRVLALATKSKNRAAEVKAHLYLGETELRMDAPNAAKKEFAQAAAGGSQFQLVEDLWQAQYGLGRVARMSGDLEEAERQIRRALNTIESVRGQLQISALKTEFLAEKRAVYDALISLLLLKQDVEGAFECLERSRARSFQDRLEAQLSRPAAGFLKLRQFQELLDDKTVLIELWEAPGQMAALWLTRHAFGVVRRDLSADEFRRLDALASRLPESLTTNWRQDVSLLRLLLPPPLRNVEGTELAHVIVVPDGLLSTLPLDLIPITDREVLIERFDLTYLPSAALLLRKPAPGPWLQFPWTHQLIAFGAPAIAGGDQTLPEAGEALGPLPGSENEIREIARVIPGRTEFYLGTRDTKTSFLGGAPNGAPLLHVSTHGFADVSDPTRSRLMFSPEKGVKGADYVFLQEFDTLDLSRVDLATMSACDTERGKFILGEGTQAFSRALLAAGARSTVTTLWRIGDAQTAEFMKQFYYFAVVEGQPKAAALRSAKLKLLRSGTVLANPQHWAAFVLSGESQKPVPYFLPWTSLLLAAGGALAAISFAVWGLARTGSTRNGSTRTMASAEGPPA